MVIFWKTCKGCGESFDIGINKDYCPQYKKRIMEERIEENEWCLEDLEDD